MPPGLVGIQVALDISDRNVAPETIRCNVISVISSNFKLHDSNTGFEPGISGTAFVHTSGGKSWWLHRVTY
jgi:hypothetical protein